MASGLQRERPKAGGVLVTVVAGVLLLRALPLMRAYGDKLSGQHSPSVVAAAALAGLAVFLLAWLGIRRRPRATALAFAAVALAMVVLSGNLPAALAAVAILGATVLLGDAAFRLLAGAEAGEGDLHAVFAAGAGSFAVGLPLSSAIFATGCTAGAASTGFGFSGDDVENPGPAPS